MDNDLLAAKQKYNAFSKKRSAFHPESKNWYQMKGNEIYIYDAIGFYGVEAIDFIRALEEMDADEITLRINSPGGDVFDGTAIYNAILRHPATFHAKIDGLAASMASIIPLACDTVEIAESAFIMIHEPFAVMAGTAADFRAEAAVLDQIRGVMANIYETNSNLTTEQVLEAMAAETWYTAGEAAAAGLVSIVTAPKDEKMSFDLSVFSNAPGSIAAQSGPTERTLEAHLRDAGLSRTQAKASISAFKKRIQREAGTPAGDHCDDDTNPDQREVEDSDITEIKALISKRGTAFTD